MKIAILGAGLAGLSVAYFLQSQKKIDEIVLLEKRHQIGGLCRSIKKDDYLYDVGPHILFSKDKEMLNLMLSVLDERNSLRRSNQIIYKGKHVQYPFENDLSKLPKDDLLYCINSFENNPYENYDAENMIQFFLKTFGEGITNCYLRPYNEKIWKYDPAFMSTSMVDRIPKPTKEEIRRSASGETVDGYVHQLYFTYPKRAGIEAVPQGFLKRLDTDKCYVEKNREVIAVERFNNSYIISTSDGKAETADRIISTIPVQEFTNAYKGATVELRSKVNDLHYNSIIVAFVKTPYDICGKNFTFTIPDKEVIFHRISKMDFLGAEYHHTDEATFMVEITFKENDHIALMKEAKLHESIKDGLVKIGFAIKPEDVEIVDITHEKYAYVIYDLHHQANMEFVRQFYKNEGIILHGRFGNFEYWNMDRIVRESFELANKLNK